VESSLIHASSYTKAATPERAYAARSHLPFMRVLSSVDPPHGYHVSRSENGTIVSVIPRCWSPEGKQVSVSPRVPWYCLLSAVILVPLVVGVIPFTGVLATLNAFVVPKLIVLCLAVGLSLGSWALVRGRKGVVYAGRGLVPLGVFVAAAGLSTVFALDPRLAFFGDLEQGVGLLVMLLCALTCFLTTQLVRDEAHLAVLTSAVVLTATGVAVIGLLQQILGLDVLGIGGDLSFEWIMQRGYGTIGNADTYAAYLVLPAFLALHRFRFAAKSERNRWAACLALIVTSLVMAQTRAPIVGSVMGLAVSAFSERRMARNARGASNKRAGASPTSTKVTATIVLVSVGIGVFAAALLASASSVAARFGSLESLLSLGGRIPLWSSAVRISASHPLLGVGPDSFRLGWYPVRQVSHVAGGAGLIITDPHSVPLLIASTMGAAGLIAAAYLVVATAVAGFHTSSNARTSLGRSADYDAWLYGAVALLVTLLASLLTSVLLFMLFVAIGVLVAPALKESTFATRPLPSLVVGAGSVVAAGMLITYAFLTGAAHLIAGGARTNDVALAQRRAASAYSLARWDTTLRNLRYETMVQAALDSTFNDSSDAATQVGAAAEALALARRREPLDYLLHYKQAVLLIGAGQRLGASFTSRGIEAGSDGLALYPASVELRTGMASAHLALDEPDRASDLLRDYWDADPQYLPAGLTYANALIAQREHGLARQVLGVLEERFPDDASLTELHNRLSD